MRALVVDPESPSTLRFDEVADPVPGRDRSLVEVRHIGMNYGELKPGIWPAGTVHGHDAAGVVARTAADGSGPPVGTQVALGFTPHAWAERVAVPSRSLAVVPDGAGLADAAALPIAGLTALTVLGTCSVLGRRVLVTGASGGVGRFAVQLAALAGAHVTALTGDPGRAAALRELGAAEVVDDLAAVAPGVDLVLDNVAGPALATLWSLLAPGGALHTVGQASGQPTTFGPEAFFALGPPRTLSTAGMGDDDIADDLAVLLDLLARGRLSGEIGWRGSWRRVDDAVAAFRDRRVTGKIVLDVD